MGFSVINDVAVADGVLAEFGVVLDGPWSDAERMEIAMGVADLGRAVGGVAVMYQWGLRAMAAISLIVVFMGCTQLSPQQTCDDILEVPLREFDFEGMTQESFLLWLEQNYGLDPNEITINEYADDPVPSPITHLIEWRAGGKSYIADFAAQDLRRIQVIWNDFRPRGRAIERCFDPPDAYVAEYAPVAGRNRLELQLLYGAKGYLVHGSGEGRTRQPPPTPIQDRDFINKREGSNLWQATELGAKEQVDEQAP